MFCRCSFQWFCCPCKNQIQNFEHLSPIIDLETKEAKIRQQTCLGWLPEMEHLFISFRSYCWCHNDATGLGIELFFACAYLCVCLRVRAWFPLSSYFLVIVRAHCFRESDRQCVKCSIAHFTHHHISSLSNLLPILRHCVSQRLNQVERNERIQLSYNTPSRVAGYTISGLMYAKVTKLFSYSVTYELAPDEDYQTFYFNKKNWLICVIMKNCGSPQVAESQIID